VAVRVTGLPEAKLAEQAVPQIMPPGDEMTAPPARLLLVRVSMFWLALSVNAAVTFTDCETVTTHVEAVPEHPPPLQPVNEEPVWGVALRVTVSPEVKFPVQ
jgi:hypothetical protein